MNRRQRSRSKLKLLASVLLLAGLLLAVTGLALASGDPLVDDDFGEIAEQGFGDRGNGWAWSMQWWDGHLYVGTNYNWHCVEILAQNRNSFGIIPYPPDDTDIDCPADPLDIDMRAQIWRWDPDTTVWTQVYVAPTKTFTEYQRIGGTIINPITETVPIPPTEVGMDVGYRGMTLFKEPDGTVALYVTAVSPRYAGYDTPPRVLRTTDGVNFSALPQDPGTVLGSIDLTSIRNPTSHMGNDGVRRLYIQPGSSKGSGYLLEAADPALGNNAFRDVTPINPSTNEPYKVSHVGAWGGHLYLGIRDVNTGFKIVKMDAGGLLPYNHGVVIDEGGYASYAPDDVLNVEVLSLTSYDCNLYVGGNGITIGTVPGLNDPAELFRIKPNGDWELVAGSPRTGTPIGDLSPISGQPAGFGSPYNGHMWRMGTHNGHLYVATFDGTASVKDQVPLPPAAALMGFDLWRSGDGELFDPVTIDGLSDQIIDPNPPRPDLNLGGLDTGGRSIQSTQHGFFLGTANYWYGLRVWQAPIPRVAMSVTVDGPNNVIVNTLAEYTASILPLTTTLPVTYTWDATDQPTIVHSGGLTDSVSYVWNTTGLKYLSVRTENNDTAQCAWMEILVSPIEATGMIINEIDYDNPGPDTSEFIELKNVSETPVNLASFAIELVDGVGGGAVVYDTIGLPGAIVMPGAYYVICNSAATVPLCDLEYPALSIQDGAPDAVALRAVVPDGPEALGSIVDTVSYEGNTGAPYTEGSGVGLEDAGLDPIDSIQRFPDGIDTQQNNVDLGYYCRTPGMPNTNVVPPCGGPTPTPTPPTPEPTPTVTPQPTITPTPMPTPTVTPGPSPTPTEPPTDVELIGFDGGTPGTGVSPWLALLLLMLPAGALWLNRRQVPR